MALVVVALRSNLRPEKLFCCAAEVSSPLAESTRRQGVGHKPRGRCPAKPGVLGRSQQTRSARSFTGGVVWQLASTRVVVARQLRLNRLRPSLYSYRSGGPWRVQADAPSRWVTLSPSGFRGCLVAMPPRSLEGRLLSVASLDVGQKPGGLASCMGVSDAVTEVARLPSGSRSLEGRCTLWNPQGGWERNLAVSRPVWGRRTRLVVFVASTTLALEPNWYRSAVPATDSSTFDFDWCSLDDGRGTPWQRPRSGRRPRFTAGSATGGE